MSDLDSLVVTFQKQLSDVMGAVVKTAMFEVTRLVEDVFLVEVKRRNQEVESLRMQLQWTGGKFGDDGGRKRCSEDEITHADKESGTSVEWREAELIGCDAEKQNAPWMQRHEIKTSSPEDVAVTQSPKRESQSPKEDIPAADMKTEDNEASCCSVPIRGWGATINGENDPESDSTAEFAVGNPEQTQKSSEDLLTVIKQDPQTSAGYEDQPPASSLELDSSWTGLPVPAAGLLQNHKPVAEKERDPVRTINCLQQAEHNLSSCVRADVQFPPVPASPEARLPTGNPLGVTVKEEVLDSDSSEESANTEKEVKSFSCSVKQQRGNHIYHKTTVQEVVKLQSKAGAGLRLQAALQHLHRPFRKPTHTHLNNPPMSIAHNLNRTPSTSKSIAPSSLSVQRHHLDSKQSSARSQSAASLVGVKSQHQSVGLAPPAQSQTHSGSRHLLRCGHCGKCFPHPSNLKTHLQTHTGERPFCCSLCGRSFTKLSNLKAHRRVHTGERPYCCTACGKRFTQNCNLKRHQKTHQDL